MTDAERSLWRMLRQRQFSGFKFRRQHPVGVFIVDFACMEARLIVEVDGGQHVENAAQDERRTRALSAAGFEVLRFWNHQVLTEQESVGDAIWRALQARSQGRKPNPHPRLPPERGKVLS
jgi:very-short-patch-repair endonuclease